MNDQIIKISKIKQKITFVCFHRCFIWKFKGGWKSGIIFNISRSYWLPLQLTKLAIQKTNKYHIVYLQQKRLLLSKVLIPIFILEIFYELTNHQIPVTLFTHNKSLYDAIKSSKYFQNKWWQIDIAVVEKLRSRNKIENAEWINTKQQLADPLTKSSANTKLPLNRIIVRSISVSDPRTTVIHIGLYYMTQNNGQKNLRLVYTNDILFILCYTKR